MKRMKSLTAFKTKLIDTFIAIGILFTFTACASHFLEDRGKLDPELFKLVQTLPSKDSYPDGNVVYLLDERIVEVSSDGRSKQVFHIVFKIVSEYGKEYANCYVDNDPRTETITLVHARTITPDGVIIPLKKNAMKVVTPYSDFPEYSDYKELTFSMPGIEVGSVIDYKYVKEKKPTIFGEFNDRFFPS